MFKEKRGRPSHESSRGRSIHFSETALGSRPPRLAVNGINQLWVADVAYIRLREAFLYLAVTLDAYSRQEIGRESMAA